MLPPTMPVASCAIRPAWGAASCSPPMPPGTPACRKTIGQMSTKATRTVEIISATSIFHGVPPSRCPTFRSWIMSPAIADAQQTTAATPSTAATPPLR